MNTQAGIYRYVIVLLLFVIATTFFSYGMRETRTVSIVLKHEGEELPLITNMSVEINPKIYSFAFLIRVRDLLLLYDACKTTSDAQSAQYKEYEDDLLKLIKAWKAFTIGKDDTRLLIYDRKHNLLERKTSALFSLEKTNCAYSAFNLLKHPTYDTTNYYRDLLSYLNAHNHPHALRFAIEHGLTCIPNGTHIKKWTSQGRIEASRVLRESLEKAPKCKEVLDELVINNGGAQKNCCVIL